MSIVLWLKISFSFSTVLSCKKTKPWTLSKVHLSCASCQVSASNRLLPLYTVSHWKSVTSALPADCSCRRTLHCEQNGYWWHWWKYHTSFQGIDLAVQFGKDSMLRNFALLPFFSLYSTLSSGLWKEMCLRAIWSFEVKSLSLWLSIYYVWSI